MQSVKNLTKEEILSRAKKFIFSLGTNDGASSLCKWNFQYGLAKIHYVQEQLGMPPKATFISSPDETISRNANRWRSGYGYGGKLTWGDPNDPFIVIDSKPNACGMLVGGMDELPKPDQIIKNINLMLQEDVYIDNVLIEWDFKKGNHFIDVFEVNEDSKLREHYPKYMFVIHGSVPELRNASGKGVGIYYDKSPTLREMCQSMKTPFGELLYLEGSNAKEYWKTFQYAKWLAAERRIRAAEMLFGKFTEISNPMHQGLISYGEILLGAQQYIKGQPNKLFPVALRSDLPMYLITAKPNLTPEQIETCGFEKRAKSQGIMKELENFNAIPHGGGYKLPHINRVLKVLEIDDERYFVCEQKTEDAIAIFSDVNETQFLYRGKKIINKIEDLKLGEIKLKLNPKFILKI